MRIVIDLDDDPPKRFRLREAVRAGIILCFLGLAWFALGLILIMLIASS